MHVFTFAFEPQRHCSPFSLAELISKNMFFCRLAMKLPLASTCFWLLDEHFSDLRPKALQRRGQWARKFWSDRLAEDETLVGDQGARAG
jgi:hypothetical protein